MYIYTHTHTLNALYYSGFLTSMLSSSVWLNCVIMAQQLVTRVDTLSGGQIFPTDYYRCCKSQFCFYTKRKRNAGNSVPEKEKVGEQ